MKLDYLEDIVVKSDTIRVSGWLPLRQDHYTSSSPRGYNFAINTSYWKVTVLAPQSEIYPSPLVSSTEIPLAQSSVQGRGQCCGSQRKIKLEPVVNPKSIIYFNHLLRRRTLNTPRHLQCSLFILLEALIPQIKLKLASLRKNDSCTRLCCKIQAHTSCSCLTE